MNNIIKKWFKKKEKQVLTNKTGFIENLMGEFIARVFEFTYSGVESVTIEFYFWRGIKFTVNRKKLRNKLSLWVGKTPKTSTEAMKFLADILPHEVSFTGGFNVGAAGFRMESKTTKDHCLRVFKSIFDKVQEELKGDQDGKGDQGRSRNR